MKYIILLFLALSVMANAEVYKWTDSNGKTHYGDRPTAGNAKQIKIETKPENTLPDDKNSASDNRKSIDNWLKARDEERQIKKKEEAALAKEKAAQRRQCASMNSELRDMQRGGVVWYDLDATGQRRYYSDKEIAEQIEDLKTIIRKQCR